MNAWAANCRLQGASGASRQPLVSLRQLLGTVSGPIPEPREPNRAQTTQSSEQTADWIIEKARSHVKTTLSSSRSAWSRSRCRRGRRPHGMLEFASNVLIIDVEL